MGATTKPPIPFGDDPITSIDQDLLGRARLAEAFAEEVRTLDATPGAVAGMIEAWGSGETSLMNMAASRLREADDVVAVVEFNPWLFAGVHELAASFLDELGAQLKSEESRSGAARRVGTKVIDGIRR